MAVELANAGHSYFGLISSVQEAHAVLEASKQGLLPRVTRRLTDEERVRFVRAGAVFVWEEEEASIRRWTDHLKWSASRVSGAFLTYTELPARDDQTLIKQSFSSVDAQGSRMHLICYYSKAAVISGVLPVVAQDPLLAHLVSQRTSNSAPRVPTSVLGPTTHPPPPHTTLFPSDYSPRHFPRILPSLSTSSFPGRPTFSSTYVPPQPSYSPYNPRPSSSIPLPRPVVPPHSSFPPLPSLPSLTSVPPRSSRPSTTSIRHHPFAHPTSRRRSSDISPLRPPHIPDSRASLPLVTPPPPSSLHLPSLHVVCAGVPPVPPFQPPLSLVLRTTFLEDEARARGPRGAEDERQLSLLDVTL